MATPGAPANLSAQPGPEPNSLYVNADTVSASPTVTSYSVYVDPLTGVGKTQYTYKHQGVNPDQQLLGIPESDGRYFVTISAENSEAEGNVATEVQVVAPSR